MSDSPHDADAGPAQVHEDGRARLLACLTCALEALAAVAWAGFEVLRAAAGQTSTVGVAIALGGLLVAFAVALALMALGWQRGAGWPKTPTVVWNVLLLPVAWSLAEAGNVLLGVGIGLVALVGIGSAVATPTTFGPDGDA